MTTRLLLLSYTGSVFFFMLLNNSISHHVPIFLSDAEPTDYSLLNFLQVPYSRIIPDDAETIDVVSGEMVRYSVRPSLLAQGGKAHLFIVS